MDLWGRGDGVVSDPRSRPHNRTPLRLGNGMGESERLLVGFLIMYSGSVATGWLWAFVKAPQPAVRVIELAVQAAAAGWWLWNL